MTAPAHAEIVERLRHESNWGRGTAVLSEAANMIEALAAECERHRRAKVVLPASTPEAPPDLAQTADGGTS